MKTVSWACVVAAALALGGLELSAAGAGRFKFLSAIYVDDKGASLSLPEGVACDAAGQVVVGDTGNDRLLRFTYRDGTVGGGSVVKIPQLTAPSRIQLNSKGEIYALDSKQRRIVHLNAAGAFSEILAFDGVPAPTTIVVKSFALDTADNIYVLDVFSERILVLNAQGKFQKAMDIPADAGFVSDLTVDVAGTVLLLDSVNRRVLAAAKDAASFTPLGKGDTTFIATLPTSLTASKGVIFVTEGPGSSIAGFGRDGSFLGRQLAMGLEEGFLNYPSQTCVNDKDEVFVADRDNSRVQVFRLIR